MSKWRADIVSAMHYTWKRQEHRLKVRAVHDKVSFCPLVWHVIFDNFGAGGENDVYLLDGLVYGDITDED